MMGETMSELKTNIRVYADAEGHQHYDFVIDKEHMSLVKEKGKLTPAENDAWEKIKAAPDEFFSKSYGLMLLINMLHSQVCAENYPPSGEQDGRDDV
jgi:hypothetical protein